MPSSLKLRLVHCSAVLSSSSFPPPSSSIKTQVDVPWYHCPPLPAPPKNLACFRSFLTHPPAPELTGSPLHISWMLTLPVGAQGCWDMMGRRWWEGRCEELEIHSKPWCPFVVLWFCLLPCISVTGHICPCAVTGIGLCMWIREGSASLCLLLWSILKVPLKPSGLHGDPVYLTARSGGGGLWP